MALRCLNTGDLLSVFRATFKPTVEHQQIQEQPNYQAHQGGGLNYVVSRAENVRGGGSAGGKGRGKKQQQ